MGLESMFFGGGNSPGIFGIIHGLFTHGKMIGEDINNQVEDTDRRNRAKKLNRFTYKDHRGREYLTSNNREVFVSNGGSLNRPIYRDAKTGIPICFVDDHLYEEQRYLAKQQAIKDGKTVFLYFDKHRRPSSQDILNLETDDGWFGNIYEDVITGNHYVTRSFIDGELRREYEKLYKDYCATSLVFEYYIDISNGHIIRFSDRTIEWKNYKECRFDINKFNQIQDMFYKKYSVYLLQHDHWIGRPENKWHDKNKQKQYEDLMKAFKQKIFDIDFGYINELNIKEEDLDGLV